MCNAHSVAICLTLLISLWTTHGFRLQARQEPAEGECGDGMTIIGQFFNCTKPLMDPYRIDEDWPKPGYTLNEGILGHLRTYCGMVLPSGEHCLRSKISACDVKTRNFVISDVHGSGGFCDGRSVSAAVSNWLTSLPAAAPASVLRCPRVNTSSCYRMIPSQLYTKEVFYLPMPDLAPFVRRTFESVFRCLVSKYRATRGQCGDWQIHFLWRHARTFLPHPFGFSLRPSLLREKPFQCQYCSYATAQNSTLKVHQRRHHQDRQTSADGGASSTKDS